jgi:hypothetical protein
MALGIPSSDVLNSLENLFRIGTAIGFVAQQTQGFIVVALVFKK